MQSTEPGYVDTYFWQGTGSFVYDTIAEAAVTSNIPHEQITLHKQHDHDKKSIS